MKRLVQFAAAVALAASPLLSHAYFITPYVQLDAAVRNGYVADGATYGEVQLGSDAIAQVDLAEGTVRGYLQVAGPGGFGQAAGVMGDRLTFSAVAGSELSFHFDFDGFVFSNGSAVGGELLQIGVIANLRVFDAAAGATAANFAALDGALVSDTRVLSFDDPEAPLSEFVFESLAGSITTTSPTPLTVDVFASLSFFVAANANPVTVTMDFMNTGRFGVQAAPGVTFTSQSGVFPGSVSAVPEPQGVALMLAGLAGLGLFVRRRDQRAAL